MTDPNAAIVAHANDTLALVSAILGDSPLPKESGTVIAFGDTRNQWWGYTRSWSGCLVPFAPADDEHHMQTDEEVIERRGARFRIISRPVDTSGDGALDELLWVALPTRRLTHPNACDSCGGPGNLHWGDCTEEAGA